MTFEHSAYELLPQDSPSATRWIIEDANAIPEKVQRLLGKKTWHIGQNDIKLAKASWSSPPNLDAQASNQLITRNLSLLFENRQTNGTISLLNLQIPGVPFPNHRGAYTYGTNEYFTINHLRQKPGIFPVSSESRPDTRNSREILWKTNDAFFLQSRDTLVIQASKPDGRPANKPLALPPSLWDEFHNLLETHRRKPDNAAPPKTNLSPELSKLIRNALDIKPDENPGQKINTWIAQIAGTSVPEHANSWLTRINRLAKQFPGTAADLKSLAVTPHWNLHNANAALNIIKTLPDIEFMPPNHLGRNHVESGADKTASWIAKMAEQTLTTSKYSPQSALVSAWNLHNWKLELERNFINPNITPKNISEGTTPENITIKANLIKNHFRLVIPQNPALERTPMIERLPHPSCVGAVALTSPENENVGQDRWLCSGATRDPVSGEILRPIRHNSTNEFEASKLCTPEEIEEYWSDLERKNKGLCLGTPKTNDANILRNRQLWPCASAPYTEIECFLDMKPAQLLPLHLTTAIGTHLSRLPMAHSGKNNARIPNGAEPPQDLNPAKLADAARLTNIGLVLVSPADGTVTSVKNEGPFTHINIIDRAGNLHDCKIPRPKTNAFKQPLEAAPYVQTGDAIKTGEPIAGPQHHAYKRQIQQGQPPFPGVNLTAALIPLGWEDQIPLAEHVAASGRLDFERTEIVETKRQRHDIHLKHMRPGTPVKPGEILAWQTVNGEHIPICTAPNQGGIIQTVKFITTANKPSSTRIKKTPELPRPPLQKIIANEIASGLYRIKTLLQKIEANTDYIKNLNDKNINPTECLQRIQYSTAEGRLTKTSVAALDSTDNLERFAKELQSGGVTIDKTFSYANEALFHTLQRINRIKELYHMPKPEYPSQTDSIQIEILTTTKFEDGSKFSDLTGTKGTVALTPDMPFILDDDTTDKPQKPIEVAYTNLAVIARGAIEKFREASEPRTILLATLGKTSNPNVQARISNTYYIPQKANVTDANKVVGRPTNQIKNYLGIDANNGVQFSTESFHHAKGIVPWLRDNAIAQEHKPHKEKQNDSPEQPSLTA
jgi:hypothetical protein